MSAEVVQGDAASGVRHALVWDRDSRVVERIASVLRTHGHEVHPVSEREHAWSCLSKDEPDLAVLGFWHPDDIDDVKRVRARFGGPLVCFSGTADADDRIAVLRLGADDVVPRPLSYEELAVRVEAVIRRASDAKTADRQSLTCGPLTADEGTHQVRAGGEWVQLTTVEFALITFLMRNPRVSFTRQELLQRVWGYDIGDTSTVSVHIRRLRRKLESDPTRPALIRTVWGSGYYFDPAAE